MAEDFGEALQRLMKAIEKLNEAKKEETTIDQSILTLVEGDWTQGMPPDVKKNLNDLLAEQRKAKAALKRALKEYFEAVVAFNQALMQLAFR
jgi:predicted component of type VI protein secretion system